MSILSKAGCNYNHSSDYFIIKTDQPDLVTVGWELTDEQLLAVTLSTKLKLSGQLLDNLLKLKSAIQSKYSRLVRSNRTKLSFLAVAYSNLAASNLQSALRCLHRHTRRIIKEENKKAKIAAKEVEGQLAELSQEGASDK